MTTKIQRYDFESGEHNEPLPIMVSVPLGDYVKFVDYEKAITQAFADGWNDHMRATKENIKHGYNDGY